MECAHHVQNYLVHFTFSKENCCDCVIKHGSSGNHVSFSKVHASIPISMCNIYITSCISWAFYGSGNHCTVLNTTPNEQFVTQMTISKRTFKL